jgi:hypothetical protein
MANRGVTASQADHPIVTEAVRSHGLEPLARTANVGVVAAARVAAGAPALRSTVRAVVSAARQLVASGPGAGSAPPSEPPRAA